MTDFITADAQVAALQAIMAQFGASTDLLAGAGKQSDGDSPQTTEGPYYIHGHDALFRRDIADGRPGIPLQLSILVRDTGGVPLSGAVVDVWHCDALGYYSGHLAHNPDTLPQMDDDSSDFHVPPTDDSRFLRGLQHTDADGTATFDTIYPGWYFTRSVHIHLKIHAGGREIYTSQLYLPEEHNETVGQLPPYNQHTTLQRLPNADDLVYQSAGGKDLLIDLQPVDPDRPATGFTGQFTATVSPAR
ncbi:hypothetical protein ABT297_17425 [Dactylosporangium sp. NPDC000555]|uniref:dioxygenase family protein n=1 Tax=Dactylosporangium sp. NPDC000555 TaxID=3154260 RepID=UPI00332B48D2